MIGSQFSWIFILTRPNRIVHQHLLWLSHNHRSKLHCFLFSTPLIFSYLNLIILNFSHSIASRSPSILAWLLLFLPFTLSSPSSRLSSHQSKTLVFFLFFPLIWAHWHNFCLQYSFHSFTSLTTSSELTYWPHRLIAIRNRKKIIIIIFFLFLLCFH